MFGNNKKTPFDANQVLGATINAFMAPDGQLENGQHQSHRKGGDLGSVGAVAVGAALALTGRAAYTRARRNLDLERVANAVEERLNG